jgi:hypothetical protein
MTMMGFLAASSSCESTWPTHPISAHATTEARKTKDITSYPLTARMMNSPASIWSPDPSPPNLADKKQKSCRTES